MTQPTVPAFFEFEGAETVDTNTRSASPPLGSHEITLESMRYHQGLGGNGVKVGYTMADGSIRGHYISLKKDPRYAINYGVRDTKIAIGALQGWTETDERTKAIDNAEIQRWLGPTQPGAGKRARIDVTQGKADPKHPGEHFVNVRLAPAGGAVASPAPTPAPAPAAAPVVSKVPAGYIPNPNAPGWFYNPADLSAAQVQG